MAKLDDLTIKIRFSEKELQIIKEVNEAINNLINALQKLNSQQETDK